MTTDKLKTILAVAAIASMNSFGGSALNSDYTQQRDKQRDKQRDEHLKAISKKQRVRDEIRERRKATK